jgi:hypothetical protein
VWHEYGRGGPLPSGDRTGAAGPDAARGGLGRRQLCRCVCCGSGGSGDGGDAGAEPGRSVGAVGALGRRYHQPGGDRRAWQASCPPGPGAALSGAVTSSLPLFLLDVDGVLNPFAAPACPPGYTEHAFFPGEEPVRLCSAHGPGRRELSTRFQIVWATAWGADANRLLAPLLELPDLPVIRFPPIPFHPRDKLTAIIRFAGRHPLAWRRAKPVTARGVAAFGGIVPARIGSSRLTSRARR